MNSISSMLISGIHRAKPEKQDYLRQEPLKLIQALRSLGIDVMKPFAEMTDTDKAIASRVLGIRISELGDR